MPLKDFEDFAAEPLALPIKGKVYTVPPLGYREGVRLTALMDGDEDMPTPDEQNRLLLGAAFDEMVADNVPLDAVKRATLTALVDFRMGREAAEKVWESGLSPEALAPKTGASDTATSTTTGEASTTPTPDSGSGTTSPKASTRASGKAPRSRKSSTSGRS